MPRTPPHDVSIAAAGLITPLDSPTRDTWAAMRSGAALTDHGVVADTMLLPSPADRATRLALAAVTTLARDIPPATALFVGTSKGPVLSWLEAARTSAACGALPEALARQIVLGPAAIAADLASALSLRGDLHTSVAACSSGLHAFHRAVRAIEFGEVDRALVVAADASHHALFEASFARLGVLAPPDADGHRRCRPFDASGSGFFVCECAAALLLERAATPRKDTILASSWIGADATGLIAVDPRTDSLRFGLSSTIAGAPPAFVHAHATGTAHDAHELAAIRAIFGDAPAVISSKGHLGHSLGAAGLVSLALSCRAHHERMLWTGLPVPDNASSLTISQGFGGHIAIVRLQTTSPRN